MRWRLAGRPGPRVEEAIDEADDDTLLVDGDRLRLITIAGIGLFAKAKKKNLKN